MSRGRLQGGRASSPGLSGAVWDAGLGVTELHRPCRGVERESTGEAALTGVQHGPPRPAPGQCPLVPASPGAPSPKVEGASKLQCPVPQGEGASLCPKVRVHPSAGAPYLESKGVPSSSVPL